MRLPTETGALEPSREPGEGQDEPGMGVHARRLLLVCPRVTQGQAKEALVQGQVEEAQAQVQVQGQLQAQEGPVQGQVQEQEQAQEEGSAQGQAQERGQGGPPEGCPQQPACRLVRVGGGAWPWRSCCGSK